jgi:hypothetical protein
LTLDASGGHIRIKHHVLHDLRNIGLAGSVDMF